MFWFFGLEAWGILAPWPGIKPAPPALEGEVLTTREVPCVTFLMWLSYNLCGCLVHLHPGFSSPSICARDSAALYCDTFPYSPNTQGFEVGFPRNCLSAISEGLATNYFVLSPKYNFK